MPAKDGDKVSVEYEGRFESGEVFDSTKHGDHSHPLTFELGKHQVVKGFEDAVRGMEIGESKKVTLKPEEAYGAHNPELLKKIEKSRLPEGQKPEVGFMLMLKSPQGHQMPARITEVGEKEITIDLNHPLAGKTLIFTIELKEIKKD